MNATPHAVPLEDLRLVLFAHRLRRRTGPPIAPLAVMTPASLVEVDCSNGRTPSAGLRAAAMNLPHKSRVTPLQRGWVCRLFNRVQAQGRAEVLKTWRTGVAALRREPQHVLHLPLKAKVTV